MPTPIPSASPENISIPTSPATRSHRWAAFYTSTPYRLSAEIRCLRANMQPTMRCLRAGLAHHGHVAAHHARELARESEAEPRPAVAARGQGISLGEVLEQLTPVGKVGFPARPRTQGKSTPRRPLWRAWQGRALPTGRSVRPSEGPVPEPLSNWHHEVPACALDKGQSCRRLRDPIFRPRRFEPRTPKGDLQADAWWRSPERPAMSTPWRRR
jgi:hypothetical protein